MLLWAIYIYISVYGWDSFSHSREYGSHGKMSEVRSPHKYDDGKCDDSKRWWCWWWWWFKKGKRGSDTMADKWLWRQFWILALIDNSNTIEPNAPSYAVHFYMTLIFHVSLFYTRIFLYFSARSLDGCDKKRVSFANVYFNFQLNKFFLKKLKIFELILLCCM